MVFMNAKKRNKTFTLVIVGFLSVGLLLSVSLYWQNTGTVNAGSGTGAVAANSPEASAGLKDFNDGASLMQQNKVEEAQKKFASAIKNFEEALKKTPNDYQVLGDLATAYYYSGNADKAIENVKKALEISPNFSPARMNYAIYLGYGKNNAKDAITELNKIAKGDQNYDQAQQMIAELNKQAAPSTGSPTVDPTLGDSANAGGIITEEQANAGTLPSGHPNIDGQGQTEQQTQQNKTTEQKTDQTKETQENTGDDEVLFPGQSSTPSNHPF